MGKAKCCVNLDTRIICINSSQGCNKIIKTKVCKIQKIQRLNGKKIEVQIFFWLVVAWRSDLLPKLKAMPNFDVKLTRRNEIYCEQTKNFIKKTLGQNEQYVGSLLEFIVTKIGLGIKSGNIYLITVEDAHTTPTRVFCWLKFLTLTKQESILENGKNEWHSLC